MDIGGFIGPEDGLLLDMMFVAFTYFYTNSPNATADATLTRSSCSLFFFRSAPYLLFVE